MPDLKISALPLVTSLTLTDVLDTFKEAGLIDSKTTLQQFFNSIFSLSSVTPSLTDLTLVVDSMGAKNTTIFDLLQSMDRVGAFASRKNSWWIQATGRTLGSAGIVQNANTGWGAVNGTGGGISANSNYNGPIAPTSTEDPAAQATTSSSIGYIIPKDLMFTPSHKPIFGARIKCPDTFGTGDTYFAGFTNSIASGAFVNNSDATLNGQSFAAWTRRQLSSGSNDTTSFWRCRHNLAGSSHTSFTTDVPADNTWRELQIKCDGTNFLFYADGVLKYTASSNIPDANTVFSGAVGNYTVLLDIMRAYAFPFGP